MQGLEELGKKGYEKQLWGSYEEAIAVYTSAIRKYPNDPRSYNNRCLCYLELKEYDKAMEDAESMIIKFPANKKSYYRKAEILAKLGEFEEAEEFFRQVLKLDPMCEEARVQAIEAQVSQICKGLTFSREQALRALNFTGNVEYITRLKKTYESQAQPPTPTPTIATPSTPPPIPLTTANTNPRRTRSSTQQALKHNAARPRQQQQ
ncbi:stress-induced-phosphoprotein 1 [Anabrus simplex]|uniref:stress-induced-phosphoprotein 1 n=1 Tax=Anabrus simplex TaxID=316456 RepID=UPI0035A2D31E